MANPEHLEILNQDIQLRLQNPANIEQKIR